MRLKLTTLNLMGIDQLTSAIISRHTGSDRENSLLVGISGIDSSGKGYVSLRLAIDLRSAGYKVALINTDGWLNLPKVRFSEVEQLAGPHFYKFGVRLDEMFERLIVPLVQSRSVDLTMDYAEETAAKYRMHRYLFRDIDIVLLEGIFLFKRALVNHFDLKIWIESALKRAVRRGQEGLSQADTIAAYQTIYFPAQRYHFDIDDPMRECDLIFENN
jgi:uridine kinase